MKILLKHYIYSTVFMFINYYSIIKAYKVSKRDVALKAYKVSNRDVALKVYEVLKET